MSDGFSMKLRTDIFQPTSPIVEEMVDEVKRDLAELQKCREVCIQRFIKLHGGVLYGANPKAEYYLNQAFASAHPNIWRTCLSLLGDINGQDLNACVYLSQNTCRGEHPWELAFQRLEPRRTCWKNIINVLRFMELLNLCDDIMDAFNGFRILPPTDIVRTVASNATNVTSITTGQLASQLRTPCTPSHVASTGAVPKPAKINQTNMSVFLTYAEKDAEKDATIFKFKLEQRFPGIVIITHNILNVDDLGFAESIESVFHCVDYVIPIISKLYVEALSVSNATNDSDAGSIRYMYAKYLNNFFFDGCKNVKVRALRLQSFPYGSLKYLATCLGMARDNMDKLIDVLYYPRNRMPGNNQSMKTKRRGLVKKPAELEVGKQQN